MSRFTECGTRRLKIARHLQRTRPEIVPSPEPLEGFNAILEGGDPMLRFQLRDALDPYHLPAVRNPAASALFNGTIFVVRLAVGSGSSALSVSPADVATVTAYATESAPAIARYAGQYGTASLAVQPTAVPLGVAPKGGRYNDSMLQTWVNALVQGSLVPSSAAAVLILNPPGALNSDADPSRGVLGYHGLAKIPYAFVNVLGSDFTLADATDQFALATSHEIAELTVDPLADLSNPEVCDPCGPNCQIPWRDYFDASGAYLGSQTAFPRSTPYAFYINAIVRPASATACPAPPTACNYSP